MQDDFGLLDQFLMERSFFLTISPERNTGVIIIMRKKYKYFNSNFSAIINPY